MRGMKSLVAPTKRQNYADGGVVGAIKGMFGIKPEDPERARRLAEYQANAAREKEAAKAATAPAPAPAHAITDYAAGSALKRREAAAGLKDGGPVRGPGTGTSDDVPDNVPEGTYIMPADSTQAIGEKTLGGLGMRGIDVNLSNGEFKLPPKQVHAIGVQTLNQLKDATHTPSSTEAAKGMKPELFFEGGGVASEEERQKRINQIPAGSDVPAPAPDGQDSTELTRNVNNGLNALGGMGVVASVPLRAGQAAKAAATGSGATALPSGIPRLAGPAQAAAAPAADFVAGMGPGATTYANTIPRIGNAPTPVLPGTNAALQQGAQANVMSAATRTASGANAGATALDSTQRNNPAAAPSPSPATAPATAPAPAAATQSEYGRQMSAVGGALVDGADWLGKTIVSAPGYGFSKPSAAPAPAGAATANAGAGRGVINPASANPAQTVAAATAPTNATTDTAAAPTQPPTNEVMPGVYRHGRGQYSDNATGMGFTSVPGSGGQGTPVGKTVEQAQREGLVGERVGYNPAYDQRLNGATGISAQNMAAADALAGRSQQESMNRVTARGMGALAGGPGSGPVEPGSFTGGFSGVIGTDPRIAQQERERSALVSALSSPLRGAQNGQLTASQRQGMAGLLDAERRDASGNRQADQTAATQRDIAAMREAGENGRAFLRDAIDQQRVGVDAQRYGVEAQAKGLYIRAAQRRESAYDNYRKAKTDEDRQAIAKQFPDLFDQAKDAAHRMEVVRGKTDPMTGQSSGDYVVVQDPKTGEVRQIQMGAASAAPTQELPPGMKRQIGTSNGRPVYEDMNGKQVIAKG